MKALGMLTAMALTVATAGAVLLVVRSIPDIRRYLRMRAM
ncbi:MAG: hypothetical protein QOF52_310 [Propionibacteriaceae bacterium]|nr:hypothetical protein [Propionibacteriaceae bacterium]MDX6320452.1 hypothetical protein [Propionibacteriaceae bacterium]